MPNDAPTLDELIKWVEDWALPARQFLDGERPPDWFDLLLQRRIATTATHLRRLRDVERACDEVAPDNCARIVGADAVDAERPRYVIVGEDGEPIVAEDEPAELVVAFARWVGTLRGHIEEQERRLRALDAAVQQVRALPQESEDVGNTHEQLWAEGYNAALRVVRVTLDPAGGGT